MIIPIFIHVREKTYREIFKEMESERRFREAVERDEANRRRIEEEIKRKKEEEKMVALKKAEAEYYRKREENPWDYQFMPEGWTIFGTKNYFVEEY